MAESSIRTTVHLVRHGEVYNPTGVLYGRLPDFHLSELGQQMAERVGQYFADSDHDVTRLIASPLERAQETAAPTATMLGLDVHTDERVIEAGNSFEGKVFGVGDKCPPISATKALTGHSLGATGVQEAIYSLLMMQNGFICESANITELDPVFADMPIVRKRIDNARLGTVLSNSFGFGGTNATLVFKRMDA